LFLTTNRVSVFDPAFLSRIHVSLRFSELDHDRRLAIWRSFLGRPGAPQVLLQEGEWHQLAERKVNGRQLKNAVRTAHALAASKKETMSFRHLDKVLSIVEEFEASLTVNSTTQ